MHAALGADDDLAYLVTRLRDVWPDVVLHFRGDGGFGVPAMYDICERLRVWYTFGLSANSVLQRQTEDLLAEAVDTYERERQMSRQQDSQRPTRSIAVVHRLLVSGGHVAAGASRDL